MSNKNIGINMEELKRHRDIAYAYLSDDIKVTKCPPAGPDDISENTYVIKRLGKQRFIKFKEECILCGKEYTAHRTFGICPACR